MSEINELVSIVIPCYNLGKYLEEAIDSARNQTYKNTEIILVDDGSTDKKTISLVGNIKKNFSDITVIMQKNAGPSGARNAGINIAKGAYILCLDADDLLHPKYIEKEMSLFKKSSKEVGFITTWLKEFGKRENIWKTDLYNPGRLLVENIVHGASIFRKEAWERVGGYKTEMRGGYEDWEFWISIVEAGYKWELIPEVIFMYRIRDKSVSSIASAKHIELYKKIIDFHPKMFNKYANELAYISSSIINSLRLQSSINIEEANSAIRQLEANIRKITDENTLLKNEINTLRKSRIVNFVYKIGSAYLRIKNYFLNGHNK